jgi:subtilisin family serine protease
VQARQQYEQQQLSIEPVDRYIALTGLILWAAKRDASAKLDDTASPEQLLQSVTPRSEVSDLVHELFQTIRSDKALWKAGDLKTQKILSPTDPLVWQISLNRRARPALEKSRAAVKADAVTNLFQVNCKDIAWAVLDSGIHRTHPAFMIGDDESRVRRSFNFKNIRKIVSLDNTDQSVREQRLGELYPRGLSDEARAAKLEDLRILAEGADERRPIDWERVESFITIEHDEDPSSNHGTHVAGIIGAKEVNPNPMGMCPDVQLYDFRILTKTIDDTEFAVIAALQYIRYLNSRSSFMRIHGANLSLSIPHDVRNYACGRTPVCIECERLVESGVVVVAAAGNHGYHSYQTKEGLYEGYAAFSITDPGNADGVITVGATHRFWPHTYGVSFFSSRGPTGDGRLKPDLVAPGERIRSTLPNGKWGELDGTSMAAPHVSGAAAMLMARYPELVGRPRRIKQILCDSATDLQRERSFQGNGMLDVLRAFQSI